MIIYFDTETTGLYPGQICQLSYVMQDEGKVVAKNFFSKKNQKQFSDEKGVFIYYTNFYF